jgi:hypothetical protein
MNEEQWMATTEKQNTQQQRKGEWSKISTLPKNGLTQKNAQQIFSATAENRVSNKAHSA